MDLVGQWPLKYVVADSPVTVDVIADKLDEPRPWVESVLRDVRFVLDRFAADDFAVLAPPLLERRRGEPVWVSLRDQPDECIDREENLHAEHLASTLGLDLELARRHPVVGTLGLLVDRWESRGLDLDAWQAGDPQVRKLAGPLTAAVCAWLDLWDLEVDAYVISGVGLERDFRKWLVGNTDRLTSFDFPVELMYEEYQVLGHSRADVICRATADSRQVRRGDVVVIENKAHMVDVGACEQLRGRVERAGAEPPSTASRCAEFSSRTGLWHREI